jgi:hypothetical protein
MSAISNLNPHKHIPRGNADMETPKKEHIIGNSKVIFHSPLVEMDEKERSEWFQREWEDGNPILKRISNAVNACYQN